MHMNKTCAEKAARISKKPKMRSARFLEFPIFFQRFVSYERGFQAVSREPPTNRFWSLFVERNSFEENLRWKSGSDFEKPKLSGPPFLEFLMLFRSVVLKESYVKAVSKGPSTNIFWTLFVEKKSNERKLRRKTGSELQKAKIEGRTISEVLNTLWIRFFKWKVYPSDLQRAVNKHLLIPFRREKINWTKVALINWLEIPKSKNWAAHQFRSSQKIVNRLFLNEKYL